jgi:hypothetical protein
MTESSPHAPACDDDAVDDVLAYLMNRVAPHDPEIVAHTWARDIVRVVRATPTVGAEQVYRGAEALYASRWGSGELAAQDADTIGVYVGEVETVLDALGIEVQA